MSAPDPRDAKDPLGHLRGAYALPAGRIYLLGHSLGVAAHNALDQAQACARVEWARGLAGSWNTAGWFDAPARIGAKIGPLVGAAPGEVIVADSVSVNLFKLALAALQAQPTDRTNLIVEAESFPTDLYVLQAAARLAGRRFVPVARADLAAAPSLATAIVAASEVDWRSGARLDAPALTAAARAAGALMLWDLSHSAGVTACDLNGWGADLAVGCGYKYLGGGPGAPGWMFVAQRWAERLANPVPGWFGHAAPFAMAPDYAPAAGVGRFAAGTPPILSLAALEGAIDLVSAAAPADLEAKAHALQDAFLEALGPPPPGLTLLTPLAARGGHLAFRHTHGLALKARLVKVGVDCDFRAPDTVRFGFSPLPLSFADAAQAGRALAEAAAGPLDEAPLSGGVT